MAGGGGVCVWAAQPCPCCRASRCRCWVCVRVVTSAGCRPAPHPGPRLLPPAFGLFVFVFALALVFVALVALLAVGSLQDLQGFVDIHAPAGARRRRWRRRRAATTPPPPPPVFVCDRGARGVSGSPGSEPAAWRWSFRATNPRKTREGGCRTGCSTLAIRQPHGSSPSPSQNTHASAVASRPQAAASPPKIPARPTTPASE